MTPDSGVGFHAICISDKKRVALTDDIKMAEN